MVNCGGCGKFLSPTGGAGCSTCNTRYHKGCLALPDKAQISKDWVCPNCKKNVRKGDNSETPTKGIYGTPPQGDSCPESPQRESSSHSLGMDRQRDRELHIFMAEMREFRQEMTQLRESIIHRMDDFERRLGDIEKRAPEGVSCATEELQRTIDGLKRELNDRDQEALLADLDIGQLPEERGVSVIQSVTVLAARLGVTLEERDVVFAERVGVPPAEAGGRPRRVVVRLARRHLRDELLRAARVRRSAGAADGARVYVNERLTRHNRQLFHSVREECRRLQWRFSWTKRGRIFAREGEGRPIFQIRSEEDVARIFSHPASGPNCPEK